MCQFWRRLHRHDHEAKVLTAWAMTSYFNEDQSHQPAATVSLPGYSADPVVLTKAAKHLLPKIRPGTRYARAGIVVTDLREGPAWQMRRNMMSPRYTTHWDELLRVKAS